MIYHTCPRCGANLDPGERCDCKQEMPPRVLPTPKAADGKRQLHNAILPPSIVPENGGKIK